MHSRKCGQDNHLIVGICVNRRPRPFTRNTFVLKAGGSFPVTGQPDQTMSF